MTVYTVLTEEGAVVRGKRHWRLGDVAQLVEPHAVHAACYYDVNGYLVLLFDDEVVCGTLDVATRCRGCRRGTSLKDHEAHQCRAGRARRRLLYTDYSEDTDA